MNAKRLAAISNLAHPETRPMPGPISQSYEGPGDEPEPIPAWALGPDVVENVDTARLDWIERFLPTVVAVGTETGPVRSIDLMVTAPGRTAMFFHGHNLRAAVDAARAGWPTDPVG